MIFFIDEGVPAPTDPYFSSVSLLLHMDGANSGTTFTDSSSIGHTVSRFGNTYTTTGAFVYGTASCRTDGAGDYLTVPDHTAFDFTGDFTIEMWYRHEAAPGVVYGSLSKRASTANYSPFNFETNSSRQLRAQLSTTGSSWGFNQLSSALTNGVFYHVVLQRSGTGVTYGIGGVSVATGTLSGALMTNSAAVSIAGASASNEYSLDGHLDDVRITKGVARYTFPFTPPTAAFPNS